MVFANLTEEDKEAFFALLDEYFSSRPELADALQVRAPAPARPPVNVSAASGGVAAAQRALAANPQVTSAAISAGLRSVPKSSQYAAAASNPDIANAVGRVAAASLAFNAGNAPKAPSAPGLRPPAPPTPRRTSSNSSLSTTASESILPPPRTPPRKKLAMPSGLPKKLGDAAEPSAGAQTQWGARNRDAVPPVPAAVKAPIPPPPRRGATWRPRTPTPEPEPEPEYEPEYEGEWAEALYDYKSSDPNDLPLQAEQRVLVTARTSDDWWTGEIDGRTGLFPASYVKLF